MYNPTFAEIKTLLQQELDLQDETFIVSTEIMSYLNEGVDMVEATIHTIYEDYFKTTGPLSITSGTAAYSLPTDIYAQKIRCLWYNNNSTLLYEVRKIKQKKEILFLTPPAQPYPYKYDLMNSGTLGMQLILYPTPLETNSNITMDYIRNAKKYTVDADVCDIPEFSNVVVQYARWKCMSKEGHPDTQAAAGDLVAMKQAMVDTLTARVPDEHNEVVQDVSFYEDFDNSFDGGF